MNRSSLRNRCLAATLATTLALAASVLCYRLVFARERVAPTSDYALSLVDGAGRSVSEQSGPLKLVLDPFTIYRNAPNQRTASYAIDQNGFRGGLGDSTEPRFFLLGGSAAFGQDLPADSDTIAKNLARQRSDVEIVNAAVVGFLAGQELAAMVHHLDRFHPAGYIVLDGWNEIFDQYHFGGRPDGRLGFNNSFFDFENRLHTHHATLLSQAPSPRPQVPPLSPEQTLQALIQDYLANLDRMHDFATARGAHFLVAIQPEIGQKRYPTQQEQRALDAWNHAYGYVDRGFFAAFSQLVQQAHQFCIANKIPVVVVGNDPRLAESRDDLFLDPVHLSPAGSRVVAQILASHTQHWRPETSSRPDAALSNNRTIQSQPGSPAKP